ncbi:MAG: hypothetical protein ACLQBD_03650 [Syntrophobacteraceae bacterium]
MGAEAKTKKQRSPNFPSVSLEKSLNFARVLLDKYSRNFVHAHVGLKALGYDSPKSSSALQVLAALISYGLVDVEGAADQKQVRISDLAFKIIADKRAVSPDRDVAIQEAALKPSIYQKILARFPNSLPTDDAIEHELVFAFKFNRGSTNDFLSVFRQTLDYAKISQSGTIGDETAFGQAIFQEMQGDKPMIPAQPKAEEPSEGAISTGFDAHLTRAYEGEREFGVYRIGRNLKARILIAGESPITQTAIKKLIQRLETDKEDVPTDDETEGTKSS